jgi:hypothetical protein
MSAVGGALEFFESKVLATRRRMKQRKHFKDLKDAISFRYMHKVTKPPVIGPSSDDFISEGEELLSKT